VRKRLNGSENDFGICPGGMPGRGSGPVPRNLKERERDPAEEGGQRKIPPTSASIKDEFGSRVELGTVRHHLLIAWNPSHYTERKVRRQHEIPRMTLLSREGGEYLVGLGVEGTREDSSTFKVDSQAGRPPSSTLEFVWPNARNMKRARGEENIPEVSYLGRG